MILRFLGGGVPEAFEDWEDTDSLLPTDVSSLSRAGLSEDGDTVRAREQATRDRTNGQENKSCTKDKKTKTTTLE